MPARRQPAPWATPSCWRRAGSTRRTWRRSLRLDPALRPALRSMPPPRRSRPRPRRRWRRARARWPRRAAWARAPWAASAALRSRAWAARGRVGRDRASHHRSRGRGTKRPSGPRLRSTCGWRVRPLAPRARRPSARKFPVSCPAPVLLSAGVCRAVPLRHGVCCPVNSLLPPFVLTGSQLRPQLLGDRLARAEDARAHGADRAIHDLRDLLVRQSVELAQRDRGAQLLGKCRDRVVHRLGDLLARELALGRVDVAQSRRVLEAFGLLAVEFRRGRRAASE